MLGLLSNVKVEGRERDLVCSVLSGILHVHGVSCLGVFFVCVQIVGRIRILGGTDWD